MRLQALTTLTTAAFAAAAPFKARQEEPKVPNVTVIATGGTIAGVGSTFDTTGYKAGVRPIVDILGDIPDIETRANVSTIQYSNLASEAIVSTDMVAIAKLVNNLLCAPDADQDGVVITQGTDTTEETAFLLDSLINCNKPVVVTASMRPGTAVSPDGPGNLLDAITLAGSETAKDRGAMVVLNDKIQSAFYTSKMQANNMNAFSEENAEIGGFLNYEPYFYYTASQPFFKKTFNLDETLKKNDTALPKVDVIYGSQDFDTNLLIAAVAASDAKGIVIQGVGEGSIPTFAEDTINSIVEQGIPVVVSAKPVYGAAAPKEDASEASYIKSGFVKAAQAKIYLELALANDYSMDDIRTLFEVSDTELAFIRHVSPSTPLKLAKSSTNPYLNVAGLTDVERWPEMEHIPASPTLNNAYTLTQASKSSDLIKPDDVPATRGSSLQYTQTIVGPGRSLALSMRTNARLSQDVAGRRRAPLEQRQRYLKPGKSDVDSSHDEPPPVIVHGEDNEESDTDNIQTIQSDEDEDDYVVDYDSQLVRNGTSPSSASYNVTSQVPNNNSLLTNVNSQTLSSADIPLQTRNTHTYLETRPRGTSTSTADADDEDDFRQQQIPRIASKIPDEQTSIGKFSKTTTNSPPISVAQPPHSPLALAVHNNTSRLLDSKRPLTMTRGNSLSAVEELNQETQQPQVQSNDSRQSPQSAVANRFRSASVSTTTTTAHAIDDRKVDPRILQKINKEKDKDNAKADLLKKRPLQPPQQSTVSALSKLIQTKTEAQKASQNGREVSYNPFRRLYAAMDASEIGSSVKLSLYFPHSTKPKEPIRVQIRKDATCEEVIGFGLYLFVEQREKDSKEMLGNNTDDIKWTPEGWNLRIVEEDGEVDEDFPALDRLRPVSKFSFDELAICEATAAQVRSNQLAVSKVQRRQSRITEDPFTGTVNSNNSNGSTGNPLLAPSNPTNASSSSLEGAIEQSHQIITPTLSRSATAGVSSSLAPSVYLRIEVHPTADVSYTTTVSVPSDMYLQDVLEMVCTKKNLKNPNSWALLVKSAALVIPLDRTVASLEGVSSLMLVKRSHIDADLRLDRRMEMARSTNPNASIFKRLSKDPRSTIGSRQGTNSALDYTSAYRKYTVNRRILGLVGKHERVLAIDGDWIHLMPPEQKAALIDSSTKTRSYHAANIKTCKQIKKGEQHFRIDFWRGGNHVKRYEFEAESVREANEIITQVKNLMALFKSERNQLARIASKNEYY
ncbi:hypothetical protein E3Q24_03396 [Wallemia mellicola]|nr:hypothetical protein E3Q24_03396 [Wallemia mellicola]TIC21475.1 SIN1-domain-containing protein [Wallemia mellicola]